MLETSVLQSAEPQVDAAEKEARITIALEAISRLKGMDIEANPALKNAVLKVLEAVKGTPRFVELVKDFSLKDQNGPLLEYASLHPSESPGVDAIRLVLSDSVGMTMISGNLTNTNQRIRGLIEVLGNSGERSVVALLEPLLSLTATNGKFDINARKQLVRSLTQTKEGCQRLLARVREGSLAADLKSIAGRELQSVRWPELKKDILELYPPLQGQNSETLPAVADLVKRKGDPKAGAEVYRRETVGCIKCHQVNGEGVDFGPKLSEIGTKLGKDALYEAILDPSAGISFGFEAWQIELKNGDETFGLVVSETAEDLAVKTQNGITTRYKKSDIAKREMQKSSIMPAGLQMAMSVQDLVNLVEYLSSLKATK